MNIVQVTENKKQYLDLLLLADEQEDMIDRYLERGDMLVLDDGGVQAVCVVTREAPGVYELKNIAVRLEAQRKGYGRALVAFAFGHYPDLATMLVGTGDAPGTLNFYRSCGFTESPRVKNFFTDNYDHVMIEDGVQLVDMVYLKKER
jgi:GNAT superfamily N-acetyltransferase